MPFIEIKILPGATKPQKARLIKEITKTMVQVMKKDPETVRVVIHEISMDDWGVAGETIRARRKRGL